MKILALIALMSIAHHRVDYDQKVMSNIRQDFFQAAEKADERKDLMRILESTEISNSNFIDAYLGATMTMYAECEFTPWSKYTYFKDGKNLLESAIQNDPGNMEFRYLRFMIQCKTPAFLDYNDDLDSDFALLKSFVNSQESGEEVWVGYFKEFVHYQLKDDKYNLVPDSES